MNNMHFMYFSIFDLLMFIFHRALYILQYVLLRHVHPSVHLSCMYTVSQKVSLLCVAVTLTYIS